MRMLTSVMVVGLLAASSAEAANRYVTICFRSGDAVYDDTGRSQLSTGAIEDYWTPGQQSQQLAGVQAVVKHNSYTLWSGYTTSAGCTSQFLFANNLDSAILAVSFYSAGKVGNNYITVLDGDGGDQVDSETIGLGICLSPGCGSTTQNVSLTLTWNDADSRDRAIWRTYAAGAYALTRHGAATSGKTYRFKVMTSTGCGNCFKASQDAVLLSDVQGTHEKFTIVHELGHAINHHGVTNGWPLSIINYEAAEGNCPTSTGVHSMGSKEFATAAISEAFAHFVALDAFNNHGQSDGVFQYYKNEFTCGFPAVDAQVASTDLSRPRRKANPIQTCPLASATAFPREYMTNICQTPHGGRGVEVDWMRVFWQMHTTGGVSFAAIVAWLSEARSWNGAPFNFPPIHAMHYAALSTGGTLSSAWTSAMQNHGVMP